MANFKQAPKLYHTGKKHNTIFYQLPQDLMDIVFTKLDGKCGNQIKLMCVLLGTQGNGSFGVSEKWICDRTGMVQQTYNKARKALIDKGWLKLEDGKLFVLISSIYAEGTISECVEGSDYQKPKTEGTISKCAEGTISECGAQFQNVSSAQSENVYNIKEINNNNKKGIDKGDFVATPVRKNELPTPQMRNTDSAKTNLEVRKNDREIDIIDNNINNIDIGDFVAPQQNPATSLATQVSSVSQETEQVEAVAADKVITINCSDMRDSYYHLYKYLAKYQPTLASFVVNGVAFCRNNKERTDKAIEICNTYGYTIEFNDTAAAVAGA